MLLLKHAVVEFQRVDPLRLDGRIERQKAALREIEIEHFLLDAGPFLHLLDGAHRIGLDPLAGVVNRLDEGDDDLGIFLGKVLPHDGAVQIGHAGLRAVIDFAAGAAVFHDFRPRAEIGVCVDLAGGDIGGADGRRLVLQIISRSTEYWRPASP